MNEEIRKKFEEIESYNPSYTGHRVTLKSCFKRARHLAKKDSHSGLICNNQDAAKVVFLCKTLSDIKAGAESVQGELDKYKPKSSIQELLEHNMIEELTTEQINSYFHIFDDKNKKLNEEIQQLKADKAELVEAYDSLLNDAKNNYNLLQLNTGSEPDADIYFESDSHLLTKHKEPPK